MAARVEKERRGGSEGAAARVVRPRFGHPRPRSPSHGGEGGSHNPKQEEKGIFRGGGRLGLWREKEFLVDFLHVMPYSNQEQGLFMTDTTD